MKDIDLKFFWVNRERLELYYLSNFIFPEARTDRARRDPEIQDKNFEIFLSRFNSYFFSRNILLDYLDYL